MKSFLWDKKNNNTRQIRYTSIHEQHSVISASDNCSRYFTNTNERLLRFMRKIFDFFDLSVYHKRYEFVLRIVCFVLYSLQKFNVSELVGDDGKYLQASLGIHRSIRRERVDTSRRFCIWRRRSRRNNAPGRPRNRFRKFHCDQCKLFAQDRPLRRIPQRKHTRLCLRRQPETIVILTTNEFLCWIERSNVNGTFQTNAVRNLTNLYSKIFNQHHLLQFAY